MLQKGKVHLRRAALSGDRSYFHWVELWQVGGGWKSYKCRPGHRILWYRNQLLLNILKDEGTIIIGKSQRIFAN